MRAGNAADAIRRLRARGYTGLNVTTPLKEEAFACAELHDVASLASGAANTLLLGARIRAYNTDGIGAVAALREAGLDAIAAKGVLVLGTGPAARAAITALRSAGAAVAVWNRRSERSMQVAATLGVAAWSAGTSYDAVFAALPPAAEFDDAALTATLRATPIVVDANYGARATLGKTLRRNDVHDGRAMLEAGARASFDLYRRA